MTHAGQSEQIPTIGMGDLAFRLSHRRGAWMALLIDESQDVNAAVSELHEEVELMSKASVKHIAASNDVDKLAQQLSDAPSSHIALTGLDAWSPASWRRIDQLRSLFRRHPHNVILLLSPSALNMLMRHAPNLSSWVGNSIWRWDAHADELDEDERDRRLDALRAWSGLTDDEVIQRATDGELPPDPEYAEWLVLLNRGDLIRHG